MTYTKTYYSPGDPGWANGMILFIVVQLSRQKSKLFIMN